jgi:hypothetical protein
VGTVKKSTETNVLAWLLKKVRHVCEGGLRCRTMYLATLVSLMVMPNLSSSPWMWGAPPRRVVAAHLPDQIADLARDRRSTRRMPVFEVLEQQGLEVYLVNAQHTKNVPGRKSDVQECQWLLKLHAFGLLNNSFQPTDEIRIARTI